MRSSISLSKIKRDRFSLCFLLTIAIVIGGSYIHYLLYSPTAEDISGSANHYEYFVSRAEFINRGDIGFIAGMCLGRRMIHRCNVPKTVKLVNYSTHNLYSAERIIIFEDTSFHLFNGRSRQPGLGPSKPPDQIQSKKKKTIKSSSKSFLSFAKYLNAQRELEFLERQNKSKVLHRMSLGEVLLSPLLFRQFLSEHAAHLGTKILPLRVHSTKVWTEFFERYKKYFKRDFDTQQFYLAWQNHRQSFVFPKLKRALQKTFITADSFKTALPGSPDDGSCLDWAKGVSLPSGPNEYVLYSGLRRLVAAHDRNVKVSIVFLPYNPKFEILCKEKFKRYYIALQSVADYYGWPVIDLRAENDQEIAQQNIFRDRIHFWTDDYHPFFDIMAKKIGRTHNFASVSCIDN